MQLTDELIVGTINSISGFIIAKYAEEYKVSLDIATETFYNSKTYKILSNKETCYYSDSIPEIFDMFLEEIKSLKSNPIP